MPAFPMRNVPLQAIQDASRAIDDVVVRTPLVRLDLPAEIAARIPESRVFLKLETLQPIGSFKIRGAHNVVRQLSPAERRDGMWPRFQVPRSRFHVRLPSSTCHVRTRELETGIWTRTWNANLEREPGTRTWNLELETRNFGMGRAH